MILNCMSPYHQVMSKVALVSVINLHICLSAIKTWMGNNRPKLNDSKTEIVLLGSPYFLKMSPHINIAVGDSHIDSVSAVRDLGAFFDEHMSMDTFVHIKCATIQCQLRKLYRILLGTKKANIDHLQRLQNSAARSHHESAKPCM